MAPVKRSKRSQLTEVFTLIGLAMAVVVLAIGGYFVAGAIFYHRPHEVAPWALKGAPNVKPVSIADQ